MFIVKNCGRGVRFCVDVDGGDFFFIVNCYCFLNIVIVVDLVDDVINLD